MLYTIKVRCALTKDIEIEADTKEMAIKQALNADIFDTDDIETEIAIIDEKGRETTCVNKTKRSNTCSSQY